MQIDRLRTMLDAPAEAESWLRPLGFTDIRTGHDNLTRLATAGVPLDLLGTLCEQFAAVAPKLADPDMALNNLERYLLASRSPLAAAALFERDRQALAPLLMLFNASQNLSDMLCTDPESYDLLRMTGGRAVARDMLVEELVADVRALSSEEEVMTALRRFKRRETLRIAYGDIVKGHSVAKVTRQISYVADAIVEAALDFATRQVTDKQFKRNGRNLRPPHFVVLALGKLGGRELNYSSDIDLVMLYQDAEGVSGTPDTDGGEFAQRLAREVIKLLTESTDLGFAYRVDMRLRPDGSQGQLCTRIDQALAYYDTRGRTWERQAYVKARAIAGDIELGKTYLHHLRPWIYRRYLSLADITGIKGLKRKIEKHAEEAGVAERHVKTGRGGIRDIEFVIQFLQLLNGGAIPALRTGNTFAAIERLEHAGCLTHQERTILEDNYSFLRKTEHRLQIMFDLQTHELPVTDVEIHKLARRLGYRAAGDVTALEAFKKDYADRTAVNRRILDHLLHDAFPESAETEPEIDLVNDPDPSPETIERVLGRYPFRDVHAAYDNLMSLSRESIPFLSTRRCRLFLASIAPRLLAAIAQTPDPDATLITLSRVARSPCTAMPSAVSATPSRCSPPDSSASAANNSAETGADGSMCDSVRSMPSSSSPSSSPTSGNHASACPKARSLVRSTRRRRSGVRNSNAMSTAEGDTDGCSHLERYAPAVCGCYASGGTTSSLSLTPASANVAISSRSRQAATQSVIPSAAPVPSPRRRPRSSSGSRRRCCSAAMCPGSTERWLASIANVASGAIAAATSAAAAEITPSMMTGTRAAAAPR